MGKSNHLLLFFKAFLCCHYDLNLINSYHSGNLTISKLIIIASSFRSRMVSVRSQSGNQADFKSETMGTK